MAVFFDLPAELRNRIYELAVPSRCELNIPVPVRKNAAITQVCKQTRSESLPIFRANNAFYILLRVSKSEHWNKGDWLRTLAGSGIKHISGLRVEFASHVARESRYKDPLDMSMGISRDVDNTQVVVSLSIEAETYTIRTASWPIVLPSMDSGVFVHVAKDAADECVDWFAAETGRRMVKMPTLATRPKPAEKKSIAFG